MLLPGVGPKMATLVCTYLGRGEERGDGNGGTRITHLYPTALVGTSSNSSILLPPSLPLSLSHSRRLWLGRSGRHMCGHPRASNQVRVFFTLRPLLASSFLPFFLFSLPPSLPLQQPPRMGQHLELQEPEGPKPRKDPQAARVVDAPGELGGGMYIPWLG